MAIADNQNPPTTHHVLLVSLSAQGHLNPMLRLGKRLHSKGLHVTLATTEISRHRILTRSSPAAGASQISGVNLEYFSDGLPLDHDRSDVDQYFRTLNRFGPAHLSDLISALHSRPIPRISCVVNNPFVPWVADVARELRIPCAMLWIQPCTLFSIYYRFYNKLTPFDVAFQDAISAVDLPGLPLLHAVDLPSFILPSNTVTAISGVISQSMLPVNNLRCVLVNSFSDLEPEVVRSMSGLVPVKPVGPLVSETLFDGGDDEEDGGFDLWKADESCMEWLDQQRRRSVVYVSFGSVVGLSDEERASIEKALEKTKMPFLWVMKAAVLNVVDGGGRVSGLSEVGNGRVVTWAPQSRVLRHPAVGCFLTHCGWNSVLEALTAGVPLVCYPKWTDQPTNAKLVEEVFGLGLRVRPNKGGGIGPEEVGRGIEGVMVGLESESIRARAEEWRRAAKEAVGEGGSSDRNIQWFVDEIVKG